MTATYRFFGVVAALLCVGSGDGFAATGLIEAYRQAQEIVRGGSSNSNDTQGIVWPEWAREESRRIQAENRQIDARNTAREFLRKGESLWEKGDHDAAILELDRAEARAARLDLSYQPNVDFLGIVRATRLRARAMQAALNGDFDAALVLIDQSRAQDPRSADMSSGNRAWIEDRRNQASEQERAEKNSAAGGAYGAGYDLLQNQQYAAAERELRRALQFLPNIFEADTYNMLGLALSQQGRDAEAENAFETALSLKPNMDYARQNLGRLRTAMEERQRTQAASLEARNTVSTLIRDFGDGTPGASANAPKAPDALAGLEIAQTAESPADPCAAPGTADASVVDLRCSSTQIVTLLRNPEPVPGEPPAGFDDGGELLRLFQERPRYETDPVISEDLQALVFGVQPPSKEDLQLLFQNLAPIPAPAQEDLDLLFRDVLPPGDTTDPVLLHLVQQDERVDPSPEQTASLIGKMAPELIPQILSDLSFVDKVTAAIHVFLGDVRRERQRMDTTSWKDGLTSLYEAMKEYGGEKPDVGALVTNQAFAARRRDIAWKTQVDQYRNSKIMEMSLQMQLSEYLKKLGGSQ